MKQTIIGILLAVVIGSVLLFSSANANVESKSSVVLKKSNTLVLNEQVDDLSVAKLTAQAIEMNNVLPKDEPIFLYLYTPGGSISAGMELCTNLQALNRKFNTITNFAASMGFQIAQCLNDRLILPSGQLMGHPASTGEGGGFGGQFGGVEPSQTTSRYQLWVGIIERLDKIAVARTNGKTTLEAYRRAYDNELWLEGESAVTAGFADAVVKPTCDKSLSGKKEVPINYMGMEIVLIMSECPLISGPLDYYINILTTHGTSVRLEAYKKLGGKFGNDCISANITQLCPKDVTLTEEKIEVNKKDAFNSIKINKADLKNGYRF